LQDYQVLELLGKGGFGCVYKGKSKVTGQLVAVKMIDKQKAIDADMIARVVKEVEIHCQLKHPSIVELYNYFEDSNYVYLIMELCEKGEFQHHLKAKGKIAEDQARRFLAQIVKGLLYLHSHDIVHRDLSLSNLLLTNDLDVKISDFGLATKLAVRGETHLTMCGTPNYISPEIANRSPHGLESDVWSLGCILYTFLVGKPPFDTKAIRTTLNKVVSGSYTIPPHLCAESEDLINRLLQQDPLKRIPLQDILEHPFMNPNKSSKSINDGYNVSLQVNPQVIIFLC
ncbi:uncharacterized protein TRIADDRAFT_30306, partial [Trichoplax adhaerens]